MWGKFSKGSLVVLTEIDSRYHGCHGEVRGDYMKRGFYILFLYEKGETIIAHENQMVAHDWATFKGSLLSGYDSQRNSTFLRFEKTCQLPYSFYKGWGKLVTVG